MTLLPMDVRAPVRISDWPYSMHTVLSRLLLVLVIPRTDTGSRVPYVLYRYSDTRTVRLFVCYLYRIVGKGKDCMYKVLVLYKYTIGYRGWVYPWYILLTSRDMHVCKYTRTGLRTSILQLHREGAEVAKKYTQSWRQRDYHGV